LLVLDLLTYAGNVDNLPARYEDGSRRLEFWYGDVRNAALVDSLVLARTSYLVKGRSNLSDASLVFNPALPYSFCPDVPLPHAST